MCFVAGAGCWNRGQTGVNSRRANLHGEQLDHAPMPVGSAHRCGALIHGGDGVVQHETGTAGLDVGVDVVMPDLFGFGSGS